MKYIHYIIVCGLTMLPTIAAAQTDEPQKKQEHKSEIKVNKLDVIYDDEEYKGVVIDRKDGEEQETETYMYQVPFLVDPVDDDDDLPQAFTFGDDGADSEDEILLEGFDTMAIHLPKLNPADITEPIGIDLGHFSWPTPVAARPTSHFGPRRRRFHYGLDLAQPTGEPIYAAFDGVVRISKRNRSYGNLVIIHHANGLETYYAHMSKRLVNVGDQVKSGQLIGLCGNTGRSFGSHLHLEIRYMGNAINPEDILDCSTHSLINDHLELTSSSFRKVGKGNRGGKVGGGNSGGGWYRVRQGDTLEKIARRNGTTVQKLCQLNGIKQSKVLHPGDRLRVSGKAKGSSNASQASQASQTGQTGKATYTVRRGDTLYRIAKRHGITVKKLCQLNGISENATIREGQKLKVK